MTHYAATSMKSNGGHDFHIGLELPTSLARDQQDIAGYDTELDDVRSILRDVCWSLAEAPGVRFHLVLGEPILVETS